jgi:undecaprenyl-diphosphatase
MGCPIKMCSTNMCQNKFSSIIFVALVVLGFVIWSFHLNQPLFYLINSWHTMLPNSVWDFFNVVAYSKYFILPCILLVLTALFCREKTLKVVLLIIAYYVVFAVLKKAVGEARPYVVLPQGSFYWLNLHENALKVAHKSFPSGHTGLMSVFAFAMMALFFPRLKIAQVILFALIVLTALARICTGWHWPLDTLASGLIGYLLVKVILYDKKYN